ncbi:hypothetical protein F8388_022215 [Cannabis sativa]|uniref:non-specific serine/threonine protein kinase n=1 Tax=Cannabis sativa TaxID=3483 RepID=A0A7J6E7Q1_CANSA|nr:hypothetical protein F8388_022215 [Cannabis sativa]KAF4366300.1 hypothetical protein G4B88_030478 [Cannabis sativa]
MEFWSFSFLLLCMFRLVFSQSTTDPNEVAALKKMIDYWKLGRYLNLSTDPCNPNSKWAPETANPRVACDCLSSTCHITHLKIYALDIYGEIPKELFQLKKLMDLNLAQNVLSGSIPAEIGQLSEMQSFSSNGFVGELPTQLGKLTSLEQLYIDSSGVTGPIPQEFANLKSLRILWASDNLFTGKLPQFLGTLTEFIDLRIEGTSLEGPIPSSFSALTKLETLRIGDLSLEDSSLNFLENQTSLSILTLRNCRLSGEIPQQIGRLVELQQLDLSFNKLTGSIPNSFKDLTMLTYLYLGNNNMRGELPENIITPKLLALDVSFNNITGNVPPNYAKTGFSMNVLGTSINANTLLDRKSLDLLLCLQQESKCANQAPTSSFSVKSGGTEVVSASGTKYAADSEQLGAASLYTNSKLNWAVSNTGNFLFSPKGPQYIASTNSQITKTLDSELYKTARISPNSLRYFGFGLVNGEYVVELHFAEIAMGDSRTWKALGRRIFDVYIQGDKVVKDLNIKKEAGGSKSALVKTFKVNVTNSVMDIHFFWAGKGTCCIPFQGTYGPLVSAINVYQASGGIGSASKRNKKKVGKVVGIALGCVAGMAIILSMFYLWWTKRALQHTLVETDSPKK